MSHERLGEFEILVLAALIRLGDRAYGVPVRQEIEERAGRPISIGAVYTTLGRLEKKGLVTSRVGEPTAERGGRAKRYFRVETAGVAALDKAISTIDRMVEGLQLS
jgi:DNA-binding PadR family transcriptional regulator